MFDGWFLTFTKNLQFQFFKILNQSILNSGTGTGPSEKQNEEASLKKV
jgi:hypothetical protein